MDQKLLNKLNTRIEEGTLRSLSLFTDFSDFYSNDYLGFSHETTVSSFNEKGATGSRLISGNCQEAMDAELELAKFYGAEAGVMFNSGYDANIGFFSSVPQRGDTVLYDELIHASVRDGIRMSFAKSFGFKHNDLKDLEARLRKAEGTVYVAIEGLYSMDGDLAYLNGVVELCQSYGAYLIVDEAHSAGVFGADGKGLVSALGCEANVFARLVTFGKSYGSHGAIVLGSQKLKEYLVNFSRSFIYTTALPPYVYTLNASRVKHDLLKLKQDELQKNLRYFRGAFSHSGLISDVNSPIQVLQIGKVEAVKEIAEKLQKEKIAVKPIYSPTVAVGQERLRFCFHAFNTEEEMDKLISTLNKVC
jgi:8-amino-7-oxononanoate synthase